MALKFQLFEIAEKLILHRRNDVRKNKITEIKFKSKKSNYKVKN